MEGLRRPVPKLLSMLSKHRAAVSPSTLTPSTESERPHMNTPDPRGAGPYVPHPDLEARRRAQRLLAADMAFSAHIIMASEAVAMADETDPWPFSGDDLARQRRVIGRNGAGQLWQRETDRERRLDRIIADIAVTNAVSLDYARFMVLRVFGSDRRAARA